MEGTRLQAEDGQVQQSLCRQSPWIEELSGKAKAIAARVEELEAARPEQPRREEIEALLVDVPDLRDLLAQADGDGLVGLLDAFDIQIAYDKPARTLDPSAPLSNDLVGGESIKGDRPSLGGRRIRP